MVGVFMKKIIYYLTFLILLLIINSLPVSAKEIKTCTRTETNLHVRDKFNLGTNKDDILLYLKQKGMIK